MTNVARAGGGGAAALTFLGDALKGLIPVMVVRAAGFDATAVAVVGLAAFVGSIWSVFLRFRGGKGVACALGIWLVLSPLAAGIALVVFAIVFGRWRIMSLSSLSAAIALPPAVAALAAALSGAGDRDYRAGAAAPPGEHRPPRPRRGTNV